MKLIGALFIIAFAFLVSEAVLRGPKVVPKKCDLTKENSRIEFVGHTLVIPTTYIEHCSPNMAHDSIDSIPARISLGVKHSDITSSADRLKISEEDFDIKIYLEGWDLQYIQDEGGIPHSPEFTGYEVRVDREAHKQGGKTAPVTRRQQIYKENNKLKHGLVHYTKTKAGFPIEADEIYISKAKSLDDSFLLECGLLHSTVECKSSHKRLLENISYTYGYDKKYLTRAKEIDNEIEIFLKKIISNGDEIEKN